MSLLGERRGPSGWLKGPPRQVGVSCGETGAPIEAVGTKVAAAAAVSVRVKEKEGRGSHRKEKKTRGKRSERFNRGRIIQGDSTERFPVPCIRWSPEKRLLL